MYPLRFASFNRRIMTNISLRARRGFTILELLVVMMIALLVGGLSLGRIHNLMNQQRMSRAVASVRTNVELAFAMAVRNRKPVRITWDATNLQLDVTDRAGTTVFRRAGLGQTYGLPSGSVTFSPSVLEVYPNGLANGSLVVTFSSNSQVRSVSVSRAGLVTETITQ
jgi:prepilin-type N-terminal cleavage/methylation domain-containing protein